jgi:hypothetical protein
MNVLIPITYPDAPGRGYSDAQRVALRHFSRSNVPSLRGTLGGERSRNPAVECGPLDQSTVTGGGEQQRSRSPGDCDGRLMRRASLLCKQAIRSARRRRTTKWDVGICNNLI